MGVAVKTVPGEFAETPVHLAHTVLRVGMLVLAARKMLEPASHDVLFPIGFAIMVVWTAVTVIVYAQVRPRWFLAIDFLLTLGLIVASPWVAPEGTLLPSLWIAGAPLAIALWCSWIPGTIAAFILGVLAWFITGTNAYSFAASVMMVLGSACLGYLVGQLRSNAAQLRELTAQRAAIAERQRLARIVHDGVLQVLALVEREGRNLGPRGQWLARAAHEQEAALRALLQEQAAEPDEELVDVTRRNLAAILDRHAGPGVTISTPAEKVLVESGRAGEIDAAVGEALTNVAKHAGQDAQAWVLLEREGGEVVIGIRDNGQGGDPAEFRRSMERGRMGMKHSIHGRLEALGGCATLRTAPGQGVEWEFRVPIDDA